jgi:hypothetical protein
MSVKQPKGKNSVSFCLFVWPACYCYKSLSQTVKMVKAEESDLLTFLTLDLSYK